MSHLPSAGEVVTPGVRLGSTDTLRAGHGVYVSGGVLFAALAGVFSLDKGKPSMSLSPDSSSAAAPADSRPTATVMRAHMGSQPATSPVEVGAHTQSLPEIGAVVTARVIKITPRAAHVEILISDGVPLREQFKGTVRQQDVRKTEIDKVEIYRCFRPGDVILAELISLGDRHSYFLSTAKNELGVIHALGPTGEQMVPISWEEMQCPKTKTREFRKVAKVLK